MLGPRDLKVNESAEGSPGHSPSSCFFGLQINYAHALKCGLIVAAQSRLKSRF
jgi:hypothetical protein